MLSDKIFCWSMLAISAGLTVLVLRAVVIAH